MVGEKGGETGRSNIIQDQPRPSPIIMNKSSLSEEWERCQKEARSRSVLREIVLLAVPPPVPLSPEDPYAGLHHPCPAIGFSAPVFGELGLDFTRLLAG